MMECDSTPTVDDAVRANDSSAENCQLETCNELIKPGIPLPVPTKRGLSSSSVGTSSVAHANVMPKLKLLVKTLNSVRGVAKIQQATRNPMHWKTGGLALGLRFVQASKVYRAKQRKATQSKQANLQRRRRPE